MKELISVIMPVYNASKWLDKSIGCLIDQTYPRWELVAVDDNSSDNSLEILRKWAENDGRIRVFSKKNGGAAKTRAYGLHFVTGKYTFYFDADDTISNNMLETCLNAISNTRADIAMPNLIQQTPDGQLINNNFNTWGIEPNTIINGQEAFERSIEWHGTWATALYRTELFKKIACNENYLGYFNSAELITRIVLLNSTNVVYCDAKYYYNIHPESMSRKISAKYFEYLDTDIRLIQEAEKHLQPRNVIAKTEVFAFREMIELWHHYLDNKTYFSKEDRKKIFHKFNSFHKHFPKENINEMLSVRLGITPKLQQLLLLHGWPLCRMSLTLARKQGKQNKMYPWFSEEQIKALK